MRQIQRRSFVYPRLIEQGAKFLALRDGLVADAFPGRAGLPTRLALIDLSPLPRLGIKGPDAIERLRARGIALPAANNYAARQPGGAIAARLSDTEILFLPDLALADDTARELEAAPAESGCYLAPRRDSHAWFVICGRMAVPCLQKICGVDLGPGAFENLQVAQTSVARLSTIVVREDRGAVPAFHLLADSASAIYLWDCVCDAMDEFIGAPAGLAALRNLVSRE